MGGLGSGATVEGVRVYNLADLLHELLKREVRSTLAFDARISLAMFRLPPHLHSKPRDPRKVQECLRDFVSYKGEIELKNLGVFKGNSLYKPKEEDDDPSIMTSYSTRPIKGPFHLDFMGNGKWEFVEKDVNVEVREPKHPYIRIATPEIADTAEVRIYFPPTTEKKRRIPNGSFLE
ncbi:hypothetical protein KY308_04545 [Candidatus Woesearchaeota archaeon]|nr:hypothetical protein [Candidatus Woesearchaeota archaeon]